MERVKLGVGAGDGVGTGAAQRGRHRPWLVTMVVVVAADVVGFGLEHVADGIGVEGDCSGRLRAS